LLKGVKMFDVSIYNVTKRGLCASEKESFPIGNGDLGANVWMDQNEVLNILLSKTDSISEATRLLKIGLVQIRFDRLLYGIRLKTKMPVKMTAKPVIWRTKEYIMDKEDESTGLQGAIFPIAESADV